MAKNKKNSYVQAAHRARFSGAMLSGDNLKHAAKETVVDIAAGAVLGGVLGAAFGKPALLIGIGISAVGHVTGQKWVSLAGVGMMASTTYKAAAGVSGLDGMDGVKERLMAFKDSLKDRLYLDKFMKKTAPVSGMGNLQYFNYPNEVCYTDSDMISGLAELNSVEQQLEETAMNRLQVGDLGASEAVEAMEGGLSDVSDYNL